MQNLFHFHLILKPIAARLLNKRARYLCLQLTLGLMLFPQQALSQNNVNSETLALSEAISLALAEHPEMAVFTYQRDALNARVKQATILPRPTIGFTIEDAMGTGEHSNFGAAQSTLNIGWVLEQRAIESRVNAAKIAATQVDFDIEIKALDIAAQTATLFIDALILDQRLQLAKLAQKQANEVLKVIARKVMAGKSLSIEQLQSESELIRRALEVEDLEHELEASRYKLMAQWGGEADRYTLRGDLLKVPVIQNLSAQLAKLNEHPALLAFANQQRIAQSEIALTRIEARPKWQVSAGIRRYETSDDFGLVAGISIPFGNDGRSMGEVQVIKAKQAEYQSQSEVLKRALNTQLFVLLQNMKHSKHVIDTLTKQVIPLLEKASMQASDAYDIGRIGYLEWTTIKQELLSTQAQLLDAYQAIHLQHIEIQRLTGATLSN
ncbi:TolC family protein [Brumicola pallidula]|uniref:Outer membrane efflux protein n=1 Tax=Brumicola pallidula DSM 14239 = ACAM 615 TaxID=1121922 RepID=K6ZIE2_9ALTE|nr:TolC family protein [Glaciecola pallidula]GAC30122.1 outer membrane efflux protein [Glaciecola pallidula DSM 14239 = ACAM 615]